MLFGINVDTGMMKHHLRVLMEWSCREYGIFRLIKAKSEKTLVFQCSHAWLCDSDYKGTLETFTRKSSPMLGEHKMSNLIKLLIDK